MSKAAAAPAADASAAPGKSKMKLIIIAVVAVLLLGGGGAAAWFMTAGKKAAHKEDAHEEKKTVIKKSVYAPIETFTVNLNEPDRDQRFLQTTIMVEVADNTIAEAIKQQLPTIRSRILLLLGNKQGDALLTLDGKEKLAEEIAEEIRKKIDNGMPNKGVEAVLFTHFVIQ